MKALKHLFFIQRIFVVFIAWILVVGTGFGDTTSNTNVKIGTLIFNPPFETADVKRHVFTGFEIDVMSAVCERLKFNCQFIAVPTVQDVFFKLAEKKFDIAVASVIVFKGDGEHVFSTPYLPSGIQFFAKKDSKINTIEDLLKSQIGTTDDPLIRTLVTVNYSLQSPLKVYSSPESGIAALNAGEIDAFVMQTATTKYWLQNTGDAFKPVGQPVPIGLGNGAVGMLTAKPLMDQITQALLSMQQDGTYTQIYNRYVLL